VHVLIADDDPTYRNLMEDLLTRYGFEVTAAENGRAAYEALVDHPDMRLVLLDWMMPEMDGYEVCRRIKQQEWGDRIYTIIVTGSRMRDDLLRIVVAGADDYLIKPFDPLDLKIRVHAATRIIELRAELTEARAELEKLRSVPVPVAGGAAEGGRPDDRPTRQGL